MIPSASTPTLSIKTLGDIAAAVRLHLNRIRNSTAIKEIYSVLDDVEKLYSEYEQTFAAKIQLTATDKKLHTTAVGNNGMKTWLIMSAMPCNRKKSAKFFAKKYPPGFTGYLEHWLNSEGADMAIAMGFTVMVHLIIYADYSVGIGINPIGRNNIAACPVMIFPEESMSLTDRKQMRV
jgi:hypothetical protein